MSRLARKAQWSGGADEIEGMLRSPREQGTQEQGEEDYITCFRRTFIEQKETILLLSR